MIKFIEIFLTFILRLNISRSVKSADLSADAIKKQKVLIRETMSEFIVVVG